MLLTHTKTNAGMSSLFRVNGTTLQLCCLHRVGPQLTWKSLTLSTHEHWSSEILSVSVSKSHLILCSVGIFQAFLVFLLPVMLYKFPLIAQLLQRRLSPWKSCSICCGAQVLHSLCIVGSALEVRLMPWIPLAEQNSVQNFSCYLP